ncbi:MAG: CDP-diacylglycerol--glycerol-3-phosphate 3-phosphatidyltransferase [Opitutales bacterium]|nr:CDP-diacylglycerol--glycerol-3-phosphate 3-phosphatidyltransferase [Opitutales bacterium]
MKHLPNILTLSRIPLMFVIVALLCLNVPSGDTIALVLFGVAALSDWLDGYLARRYAVVSNFGKLMDALTDKIIMVGLFVTLLTQPWGGDTLLPRWCVLLVMVIICREFLITGMRLVAAANGQVLAAESAGKLKTVLQMISVFLLLGARACATDWASLWSLCCPTHDASYVLQMAEYLRELGLWSFVVAVILTIYSGTGYLKRNWNIFKL